MLFLRDILISILLTRAVPDTAFQNSSVDLPQVRLERVHSEYPQYVRVVSMCAVPAYDLPPGVAPITFEELVIELERDSGTFALLFLKGLMAPISSLNHLNLALLAM